MIGALGISKPGKKPAKEVPPNVDAVVHAATLAAHDLAVAEFGPRCLRGHLLSRAGSRSACSTQKVALPRQSLVRRPAYATAQGT